MRTPFFTKALRLAAENRKLRAEMAGVMWHQSSLERRLAVALQERDVARRDAELLALMARDRGIALEVLRDQHRIDNLEETA